MGTQKNFNDAGLGEGSVKYTPVKNGIPIHVTTFPEIVYLSDAKNKSFEGYKNILWLGNSQLHGTNQYTLGDRNSVECLYDTMISQNTRVSGFSLPNANLQEHYVILKYIATQLKLSYVIMPVFFDDTRESGLRPDIVQPEVYAALGKLDSSELDKSIESAFASVESTTNENPDMKALESTTQERVEKLLNQKMNEVSSIWDSRAFLRSIIIYDYLFKMRNTVFRINPDSKRKTILSRYKLNMEAFKRIASFCKISRIPLLIYIPPIRNDAEQPYVQEEYDQFKNELTGYSREYGFTLRNYESVIPARFWGMKQSTSMGGKLEIDFMHFQAAGHELLGKEIAREFLQKANAK
jgi:hypothetical protein